MKIMIDGKPAFELNETQKKVLKNHLHEDVFEDDMLGRIRFILLHKYQECFKELKSEWEPKLLANGVKMFPADPDEFAELVFAQPNYKCRKTRELDNK